MTGRRRSPYSRRVLARVLCIFLTLTPISVFAEGRGTEPWNVVVVLSDALRASNVGLYGYPRDTTPFVDSLVGESLVFDHAFAHYPGTPVSVSQLHTGRYAPPLLMGARVFAVPVRQIPAEYPLLPRALSKAGHHTGLVSSHYWWKDSSRLLGFFDEVTVVPSSESYAPFEELLPAVESFLDDAGDRPFFLYLHSMDTHGPWSDSDEDLRQEGWPDAYARYDTDIRRTDRGVRAVVDSLKRRGLWSKTVFVFTSDHGEEFGEVGPERWNRNHGLQIRRPLVEIPLIVHLPDGRGAGRFQAPVGLVDLAPTLVSLARPGLAVADTDGRDLSDSWLAGTEGEIEHTLFAYSGRWRGAYRGDVELIHDTWRGTTELFRVERDERNYPRLEPLDDPTQHEELNEALEKAYDAWTRDYATLPSRRRIGDPATIHVPLAIAGGSVTTPVFEAAIDDGRWEHSGPALVAGAGEKVPPITLEQPWAPGRYGVRLRLGGEGEGWNEGLEVSFDGGPPLELTFTEERRIADLGDVVFTKPTWTMKVAAPNGSVSIRSLEFSSASGAPGADPAVAEKLKALGYGD